MTLVRFVVWNVSYFFFSRWPFHSAHNPINNSASEPPNYKTKIPERMLCCHEISHDVEICSFCCPGCARSVTKSSREWKKFLEIENFCFLTSIWNCFHLDKGGIFIIMLPFIMFFLCFNDFSGHEVTALCLA